MNKILNKIRSFFQFFSKPEEKESTIFTNIFYEKSIEDINKINDAFDNLEQQIKNILEKENNNA